MIFYKVYGLGIVCDHKYIPVNMTINCNFSYLAESIGNSSTFNIDFDDLTTTTLSMSDSYSILAKSYNSIGIKTIVLSQTSGEKLSSYSFSLNGKFEN